MMVTNIGKISMFSRAGRYAEVILCLFFCGIQFSRANISSEDIGNATRNSLTMVILMPAFSRLVGHPSAMTSGGAASLALERAEEDELFSGVNLSVIWKNTECSESKALGESVELHMRHEVDVFIGPACHPALKAVSLLASYWGVPILSWFPIETNLTLTTEHSELISTYGSYSEISDAVFAVLQYFSWSKIGILKFEDDFICQLLCDVIKHGVAHRSVGLLHTVVFADDRSVTIRQGLENIQAKARILFLCSAHARVYPVLTEADNLGLGAGDHVIIHFNFGSKPVKIDSTNPLHRYTIWSSFLQIGMFSLDDSAYSLFSSLVKNHTRFPPFNLTTNEIWEMDEYALYLYDTVMAYAYAVNSSLSGRNYSHLASVSEEIRQGRFKGISGDVALSENGIRIPKYHVLHYQSGQLVIIGTVSHDYVPASGIKVIWSGGKTPRDSPECGFSNQLCVQPEGFPNHSAIIIGSVLTTAVVIGLLLTCFVYRHLHYERSLVRMTWSVNEHDVKLMSSASTPPCTEGATAPKSLVRMGCVVAVKRFKTSVDLTREVLKDLKALKELHHDNLNVFIGAAFTQHESLVLTQYCSKGSLQDVLENDDFKLDMTFKMSFAMDIARGMAFLHRSPLRSHGNLKSSNCVLDSRWVVKVTDYGVVAEHLTSLPEDMGLHQFYSRKLWTAPELLRQEHPQRKGTQMGDVYSFGVILFEILLRTGPFSYNNKTPEEIVALVKTSSVPYRPVIPVTTDVPSASRDLMTSCWEECPDLRPNFIGVKKRLVELNGGRKTSMLENMLKMLESHTNNLEELVAQRTSLLELEKQKTEKLLHQMLPKPVANQLKLGEVVKPEAYEEATIFFSDIVGFTAISSSSTPMQVVDLLNDLYITFDTIIPKHDVYKVETIGDAYMCVSGVPTKNGNRHVMEIANMALELLNDIRHFKIHHMPEEQLQLRIGLHTGPCVAGVVGLAMPRYCLFGDTVNMASRMESTGKGFSIHISDITNEALRRTDAGFVTVRRGWIDVKGKGQVLTHWLIGKRDPTDVINSTKTKSEQDTLGNISAKTTGIKHNPV